MLRQGREPRGLFACGLATKGAFEDEHWDENAASPTCMYVEYQLDVLLDPERDGVLPRAELDKDILRKVHWNTQASGIRIPNDVAAALERIWADFVDKIVIELGSSKSKQQRARAVRAKGAGFGTPETNAAVEAAAVKRVATMYRRNGWSVQAVENEKCGYDLKCRRGRVVQDVEVKGVVGNNEVFLLTSGEVAQAKKNRRFMICVVTGALTDRPNITKYPRAEFLERFTVDPMVFRAKRRS